MAKHRNEVVTAFFEFTLADGRTFYRVKSIREGFWSALDRQGRKALKLFGEHPVHGEVKSLRTWLRRQPSNITGNGYRNDYNDLKARGI